MTPIRAVFLDAFGTLVELDPPGPRLREQLRVHAGVQVSDEDATRAFRAEIRYYLAHHLEGRDDASLGELRDRCAAVIAEELALDGVRPGAVRAAMLGALHFRAFPDAVPALQALRDLGLRLLAVSNWDCSLPRALAFAGLDGLLDGVVASATVGAAKPDPRPFEAALAAAGVRPGEALHVGDSPVNDLEGAQAAGLRAVLIDRSGGGAHGAIASLERIPEIVAGSL